MWERQLWTHPLYQALSSGLNQDRRSGIKLPSCARRKKLDRSASAPSNTQVQSHFLGALYEIMSQGESAALAVATVEQFMT